MSRTVVLLWLGSLASLPSHQAALDDWAKAHATKLEAATDPEPPARYDAELVSRIEGLLDEAQIAVGALDGATAEARLQTVEQLLRQHPELPQAAYLLAERHVVFAVLAERAGDAAGAEILRQRARVLEGRRAPVFVGTTTRDTGPADSQPAPRLVDVSGLALGDELELDGRRAVSPIELVPGEHHARVLRRGKLAWAGFVELSFDAPHVHLPLPEPRACSQAELGTAKINRDRVIVPRTVKCGHWAVARPAAGGGIEIATCEKSVCGLLRPWPRTTGALSSGPPSASPPESAWPAWATWTLIGAGVAAAAAVAVWQSGAFDEPAPGSTTWVYRGVARPALSF